MDERGNAGQRVIAVGNAYSVDTNQKPLRNGRHADMATSLYWFASSHAAAKAKRATRWTWVMSRRSGVSPGLW